MSGDLIFALAAAASGPAEAPGADSMLAPPSLTDTAAGGPTRTLHHGLSLSIPSTDGLRGAQVAYEHWFSEPRVSVGITGALRQTATGDYTALTTGAGVYVRRFWRADAWLSKLPAGMPVGWFYGAGAHAATTFTHDDVDSEWLGSTLRLGITAEIGYRIAPWRQLTITPTAGLEIHTDLDVSGRLDPWRQGGFTAGLEAGWLF
jgi:hypothetical protein